MRIHEILEDSVGYIAFDGVLGTEPATLRNYLSAKYPSIDASYFAYVFTLIIQHPSVHVALTTHLIPAPDGSVRPGTQPSPDGNVGPPMDSLMEGDVEGFKGRAKASHLAGEEYLSNRDVVVRNKLEKAAKAAARRKESYKSSKGKGKEGEKADGPEPDQAETLIHELVTDDGDENDPTSVSDLPKLEAKWGSRLRLRCSDEEIYFRLTGTHEKSPKITPTIFHILSLVAKAREHGLSVIELGPLVGASQGSMHYFVKILQGLGLCAKLPMVMHASITNLVVYHSFLHQCPVWKSIHNQQDEAQGTAQAVDNADAQEADSDDGEEDGQAASTDWGFNFGPISDHELRAGHVVKERLIRLLDHQDLENHLLRRANLIPLLGWRGTYTTRQRRVFASHVNSLIASRQVESISVGERTIKCLRLAKYNSERVKGELVSPTVARHVDLPGVTDDSNLAGEVVVTPEEVQAHLVPYQPTGGVAITETLDYQITQAVLQSGQEGIIISEIRDRLFGLFKRAIEFYFVRLEKVSPPPVHLWQYSTCSVMESHGKERRLRAYGIQAVREVFRLQGQPIDENLYPPLPIEAGHFEDQSYRDHYSTIEEFNRYLDGIHISPFPGKGPGMNKKPALLMTPGPPAKSKKAQNAAKRKFEADGSQNGAEHEAASASELPVDGEDTTSAAEVAPKRREMKYSNEVQHRGRPRKYVQVVEEDGKTNRRIVGTIYTTDELPPVLIYVKSEDLVVPALEGYSGVGVPPPITPEQLELGHPPKWFWKFKTHTPAIGSTTAAGRPKNKKSGRGKKWTKDEDVSDDSSAPPMPKRQKKGKKAGTPTQRGAAQPAAEEGETEVIAADVNDGDTQMGAAPSANIPPPGDEQGEPKVRKSSRKRVQVAAPAVEDDLDELLEDHEMYTNRAGPSGGQSEVVDPDETPLEDITGAQSILPVPTSGTQGGILLEEQSLVTPQSIESNTAKDVPPLQPSAPEPIQPERGRDDINTNLDTQAGSSETEGEKRDAPSSQHEVVPASAVDTMSPMPAESSASTTKSRRSKAKQVLDADAVPHHVPVPAAVELTESVEAASVDQAQPISQPLDAAVSQAAQDEVTTGEEAVLLPPLPRRKRVGAKNRITNADPAQGESETTAGPNTIKQELPEANSTAKRGATRKRKGATDVHESEARTAKSRRNDGEGTQELGSAEVGLPVPAAPLFDFPQHDPAADTFSLPSQIFRTKDSERPHTAAEDHGDTSNTTFNATIADVINRFHDDSPAPGSLAKQPASEIGEDDMAAHQLAADQAGQPSQSQQETTIKNGTPDVAGTPQNAIDPPCEAATRLPVDDISTPVRERNTSLNASGTSTTPMPSPFDPFNTPWQRTHRDASVRAASELREISAVPMEATPSGNAMSTPDPRTIKGGRADLGAIRKGNEVIQALSEAGGALTEHKLYKAHSEWTFRVAGTDAPYAPPAGYVMDRNVFKRTRTRLLNEKRLRTRTAVTPTATGRWTQTMVDYIADLPQPTLDAYIRSLAVISRVATTPKGGHAQQIPTTTFTQVRLPSAGRSLLATSVQPTRMSLEFDEDISAEDRRMTLLKEVNVIGYLYGYISGRLARAETLHRAIVRAFAGAKSVVLLSHSPRVFSIPLLTELITIGEWVRCVSPSWYNEGLIEWLESPENKKTLLKDMPKEFRPPSGFGGNRAKQQLQLLLDVLVTMKILTPLDPTEEPDAALIIRNQPGEDMRFSTAPTSTALHYLVHDYAPLYRVANRELFLVDEAPVREDHDIGAYWQRAKDINLDETYAIPDGLTPVGSAAESPVKLHAWPAGATLPRELYEPTYDKIKALANPMKWSVEPRPHIAQRAAMDRLIDKTTGQNKVKTREEMKAIAWEWAVPLDWAEDYLQRTSGLYRERAVAKVRKAQQAARKTFERREQAQTALVTKLAAQQAQTKQEWENRVRRIAEDVGVPYSPELMEFINRQSMMSVKHRGMSEPDIQRSVKLFGRRQGMTFEIPGLKTGADKGPVYLKRPPRKDRKAKVLKGKSATRNRRNWTTEQDELLLDAEAIIRGRNKDVLANRGRAAVTQVLGSGSGQIWNGRLKKILAGPGKLAYLERLSQVWYDLWIKHRGSPELPDDNITSNTDFDLKRHIAFLREKINKNHIKLDAAANATMGPKRARIPDLPHEWSTFLDSYRWTFDEQPDLGMHLVWEMNKSEESRIGQIGAVSLLDIESQPPPELDCRSQGLLRAIINMIVVTPADRYDQPAAMELLQGYDEKRDTIPEMTRMVEEKILTKHHAASNTGRFYTFAATWKVLCEGPLPDELLDHAQGLEDQLDGRPLSWPVIGKPGELAALMGMVSNHEVDMTFDIQQAPSLMFHRDAYNTRKLNDFMYEFDIKVSKQARRARLQPKAPSVRACSSPKAWKGEWSSAAGLAQTVAQLVKHVEAAGLAGITKSQLGVAMRMSALSLNEALSAIPLLDTPVFWTGYDTARLVSKHHWSSWSVSTFTMTLDTRRQPAISNQPGSRCNPRKWVDVWGDRIESEWEMAVRATKGWLASRPGMTERILRETVAPIMDRLETSEVLQYILDGELASRRWIKETDGGDQAVMPPVEATSFEEEGEIVWWPHPAKLLA